MQNTRHLPNRNCRIRDATRPGFSNEGGRVPRGRGLSEGKGCPLRFRAVRDSHRRNNVAIVEFPRRRQVAAAESSASADYELPAHEDEQTGADEEDRWYDDGDGEVVLVHGGVESVLVEDWFEEPILEPDPHDDMPQNFDEVAGEEFALSEEEHHGPSYALRERVRQLLDKLNQHERVVIELYFGFGEDEPLSTVEIARHFDLDEERVETLLARGMARLRNDG